MPKKLLYKTDIAYLTSAATTATTATGLGPEPGPSDNQQQYTKGQLWGALKKSWFGYRVAIANNDEARVVTYAQRINLLQHKLNLDITPFEIYNEDGKIYNAAQKARQVRQQQQ